MKYTLVDEDYIRGGTQKNAYEEHEVEHWNCPLCGSEQSTLIYRERKSIGIVRCKECNLIYTNPRAIEAEQNYFGDADVFFQEARLVFNEKKTHHRDKNYEFELEHILKYKPSGTLLDIGSNMGFFLRKAKQKGFDTLGVEPAPALAEIAKREFGLKIKNSFFKKDYFEPNSFDVVTMIDVLEHVTSPKEILTDVHAVLKDDGILCVKVPNGDYNVLKLKLARMLRKEASFDLFDAYEHVVHYTPQTMKQMVEQCGLQIKKVIIPLPIHPPVWASLVGHYYQYPSPFILDWKRIIIRNMFYYIGKLENSVKSKAHFAPDLMFIIEKKN
jgi:2-polyprenyl-3-methyl-5-hydroxy-6-metoxy-1,4-benzoquinol methylase